VGKHQFYKFLRESSSGGSELELRKVDVGVALETEPWTGDGRTVTVPFEIATDQIIGRDAEGLPLVARQSARGSLRIRNGDCLIFSGMRTREVSIDRQNVHPLAAAPLIGALLESQSREVVESQVLVCLSAEAVDAPPVAARQEPAGS